MYLRLEFTTQPPLSIKHFPELAHFNTSVSDVGQPPTLEEFTTKMMNKAFNEQEALHFVESALDYYI